MRAWDGTARAQVMGAPLYSPATPSSLSTVLKTRAKDCPRNRSSVVLPCEQCEQRCVTCAVRPGSGRLGRRAANNLRGSGLAWEQRAWVRGCSMGRGTDGEFVAGFSDMPVLLCG